MQHWKKTVTPSIFTSFSHTKQSSVPVVVMVVLIGKCHQNNHFAHGPSFLLARFLHGGGSSPEVAWLQRGHKKISDGAQISEYRKFKMYVRKTAFLFIKNRHSYIYISDVYYSILIFMYVCMWRCIPHDYGYNNLNTFRLVYWPAVLLILCMQESCF